MGFRFRKSIGLGKGVRVTLSRRGIGASVGVRGSRPLALAPTATRYEEVR